jgi:hypothetical protein
MTEPVTIPATPSVHTTPKIVGTCKLCAHDAMLGVTRETAPQWLLDCRCDCHRLWRLWHRCPVPADDDEPF